MHNQLPLPSVSLIDAPLAYIDAYWSKIIRHNPEDRQTLIGLPHPYLVPGHGEMFQEMYYWDSYFMSLGLLDTEYEDMIVGMTHNLAHLFRRFGLIPNGSRYYFLSRSQPPFFTSMIKLAFDVLKKSNEAEALEFLKEMILLAEAEQENVWLGREQPHHRLMEFGLSRYFDINFLDMLASCESGWDHSTRCEDRWMHHLPVDLNSILYAREIDLGEVFALLGDDERADSWKARAEERAVTMRERMWRDGCGFFFDYDLEKQSNDTNPSLAGFFPLWAGLATDAQAERMVESWLPRFEHDGGLVTTLDQQAGRQWAFPNGWAPLQWLVVEGLDRYGYRQDANRIRAKWITNCATIFERTGAMWEKYNVVTPEMVPEGGLYGSVAGFGWSNAVFVDFVRKLSGHVAMPDEEALSY